MKRIYILLLFAGLLCSCIGDMDKVELGSNSSVSEMAWQQPETYESFLAKIYAGFSLSGNSGPDGLPDISNGDQGEATFVRSYFTLQEFPTDEIRVAWKNTDLDNLQFCQWHSDNNFFRLAYDRLFLNIAYCNEYLRETTEDKLNKRNIVGSVRENVPTYRAEVKALRALNYYFLMDLFGNIPLIVEADGAGAFMPEQKDRKFFFSWIENELKEVEDLLPEKGFQNYGRITRPAAWMVLAKLYLNAEVYTGTKHYTDCLTYLKKILQAGYTLDRDYRNMFGASNHNSPEIIFSAVYDGKKATSWGGTTFITGASYSSDMAPGTTFGINQSWEGMRAPGNFSALFDENDRRGLFWKENRQQTIDDIYTFKEGWSVTKYTNLKSDGTPGSDNMFADTDFPFFRLADVYLMYAEAVLQGGEGGSMGQAVQYLNELRIRAGLTGDLQAGDVTLPFLRDERARELYWEGHRRTDLIRMGYFTQNYSWPWKNGVQTGTSDLNDIYKLFPLPSSELAVNTKLVQNPGY